MREETTIPENSDWKAFVETSNKADVLRFLQASGWQISRRTFYRHLTDGKLKKNRAGLYTAPAVKKYAEAWNLKSSGKTGTEELGDLAAEKTRAEIERIKTTREREQWRLELEKGKYIPRDQLEMELAGRAVALEAGFDHMIYTRAPEWIALVGGNQAKADMLISSLMTAKDAWLGSYADPQEFQITFKTAGI
jgi:hypothetical protein